MADAGDVRKLDSERGNWAAADREAGLGQPLSLLPDPCRISNFSPNFIAFPFRHNR